MNIQLDRTGAGVVFIITHGERQDGPNPLMTKKGEAQIKIFKSLLPRSQQDQVIAGTGKRHTDMARVLDLEIDRYSDVVGRPASLNNLNKKIVTLADGTEIDTEKIVPDLKYLKDPAKNLVADVLADSVFLAGRPFLSLLGFKDSKSGAMYRLDRTTGQITEISAYGDVGAKEKEV